MTANENFTVLVVDDEPEILELLSYNFTKKGLKVLQAKNGVDALEKAKSEAPQLIVLDIMMPVMNGIETCRILKADNTLKSIPVLFMSATSDDYLILAAMAAGGDHFVSKPVRISNLFDIVYDLHAQFTLKHSA